MRAKFDEQMPLGTSQGQHAKQAELAKMSEVLDQLPQTVQMIHAELTRDGKRTDVGRAGMTAEQVLRAMLVKQQHGMSYDELAFHLGDSNSLRSFCRLPLAESTPKRSTLQQNIKRVASSVWEAIHRLVVTFAITMGIETGAKTRTDSTVVETDIHHPLDSSLLWDCVRVLACAMIDARESLGEVVRFVDRRRRAKRRSLGILNAKSAPKRVALYRDLLRVTELTIHEAISVADALAKTGRLADLGLQMHIRHVLPLAAKVVDQTKRRVLMGQSVAACEKIVSIFEPHTDIIVKDRRETQYGHKVFLTTGASGLIVDVRVERGNPADCTLATTMVQRATAIMGRAPEQVSFDGSFSSKANVADIKTLGVKDVAFSKHVGLEVAEMTRSEKVFKKLRDFRAGIEAGISWLKRRFGLDRCRWRGWPSFQAYVCASVLSCNLLIVARRLLAS